MAQPEPPDEITHGEPLAPGEEDAADPGGATGSLHPAEHRAYRELNAACRQLIDRWSRIGSALEGTDAAGALEEGVERVRRLLTKLEERTLEYGLSGRYAAQAAGAGLASARGVLVDRGVDTGMVVRFAVLDVEHIATLLAHLAALAEARGDERLATFDRRWAGRIREEVEAVREAAVGLGADPDRAAAPIDGTLLTRAAHGAGWVMGTLGEAWDRVASRKRRG